jgi:hypothetical protein
MKVILKGSKKNQKMEKFFLEQIVPILNSNIQIEWSDSVITVYEKDDDGLIDSFFEPTVEVIVGLTEKARRMALDDMVSEEDLRKESGDFFDEARAIKKIEWMNPPFAVEYHSYSYLSSSR